MKNNVVPCVFGELQELYRWLEEDFHPLKLSQRIASPIAFMSEKKDLKQYVDAIHDITIMRLIKQVRKPHTPPNDIPASMLHLTIVHSFSDLTSVQFHRDRSLRRTRALRRALPLGARHRRLCQVARTSGLLSHVTHTLCRHLALS